MNAFLSLFVAPIVIWLVLLLLVYLYGPELAELLRGLPTL